MNYALDITNSRIKAAMESFGIDKEELQLKSLSDFGKSTREEIKQLRFEAYSRRLEDTVKLIKDSLRTYTIKAKEGSGKSESISSEVGGSISEFSDKKKVFLSEKNKEILITALEEIKEELIGVPEKERPKSMAHPRSNKSKKIEELKKIQQQNFDRIRNDEEIKVRKALSESTRFSRTIHSANRTRDLKSISNSMKRSFNFSVSANVSEEEIAKKLRTFENKLERSRALHEKQLNMRKQQMQNFQSCLKLAKPQLPQEKMIFKIIERTSAVSERKKEKHLKQREKWEKLKIQNEQRVKKMQEMDEEYKKNISEKEATLRKKMNIAEKVIKNRKASIGKEIEIKVELQKIRDEEAYIKMKRAQKIM